MATKSKSAHWQAALRQRRREAGLKAVTLWLPKESADRLARYPEKERGEIVTRALALLESQGEFTGEAASIIGESTDKPTGEGAVALSETPARLPPKRMAALSRRAKRLSAQGVSWKEIARRFNAESIPTRSGIGQWHGSTVKHMVEKQGRGEA